MGAEKKDSSLSNLNKRLVFALCCSLASPLLQVVFRAYVGLVVVACIGFIVALPVLIRGSQQQRFFAFLLLLSSGYFAYQGWVTISGLWLK